MKAVGYMEPLPIDRPDCLLDLEVDTPIPAGRDLLVRVKAMAVNPIDCQKRATDAVPEGQARILGWDAAGVVEAVGPRCSFFAPGDAVFYAGDICRPGCNAEFQLVDERIVGRKPRHLGYTSAATLPLGSLTAWEALFDRLEVAANGASSGKSLLVIGGAGGVGSLAIQLARKVAQLRVIATASRPLSRDWCLRLGAHAAIDHFGDMPRQLRQLDLETVDYILFLAGEPERGVHLIRTAFDLVSHLPAFLWGTVCLDHIRRGRYREALDATAAVRIPALYWDPLLRAAAAGQLALHEQAAAALAELLALQPDFAARGEDLIGRLIKDDDLAERLRDGLAKAGLPLVPQGRG